MLQHRHLWRSIYNKVSSNEGAMECVKVMITPDQQKRIITELTDEADHNLKQGNLYYVVSYRWMARWYRYTGQEVGGYLLVNHSTDHQSSMLPTEVERPGPVDNSDIVVIIVDSDGDENEIELRRNLKDVSDYAIVPQRVWERLIEWYGGGPAIPRQLVSLGDVNKQFYVEVYPVCLNLLDSRDNSQSIIRLSRKTSLHELYQKVCKLRQVEPAKARIWDYYMRSKHGIIEDSDKTIEKTQLHMDQDILLEVLVDGFYPSTGSLDSTGNDLALVLVEPPRSPVTIGGGPSPSSDQSSTYFSSLSQGSILGSGSTKTENGYDFFNSVAKPEKKGLAGLQNLGNTCFMNSALQCLVHTPPIVEYFLQDYSDEINSQNPLGLGGELAAAFGELLRKLWTIGQIGIIPRAFKAKLAQFAPQFSGYNQHDSQELLAFLLDGLHEDLNRVKQKPYFEVKDSGGRPDDEVAEECWTYHMARNDSIIVDVCQGQYKSTLVCPECKKISITFDPFMYLSLPLPSKVTRKITVTVFSGDGSFLPIPHTVVVLKNGVCQDLTQALATQCSLKTDERFLLAEVFLNKIYRYLEKPLEPLSTIKDEEYVVAYIIPKWPGDLIRLQIYHRCPAKYCWHSKGWTDFLTPLVTYVDKRQSKADIELAVKRVMLPMKKENVLCSIEHVTDNGNENSSIEHVNDNDNENSGCEVIMVDSGPESESDSVEMEDIPTSGVLSLKPCVIGDRFCRPVFNDSEIEPHPLSKVTLDWTSKEFEVYDPNYLKNLPEVYKTEQGSVSLFSCLDAFLKEEPLGPDDMWHCPSCKEHRQAKKKLDLWRLPEILVFHLKRFSYGRYFNNKLETFVDFDIHNLDLNKYVKHKDPSGRSYVYELYAISNHYGGLGGGHYSAYAKVIEENRWYHFDDSHVSTVDEADIKTSAAYVLFYQRVQASA